LLHHIGQNILCCSNLFVCAGFLHLYWVRDQLVQVGPTRTDDADIEKLIG